MISGINVGHLPAHVNNSAVNQKPIASSLTSLLTPQADTVSFTATKPSVLFQGALHKDYNIEMRMPVPISRATTAKILREFLIKDLSKTADKDPSNTKFFFDGNGTAQHSFQNMMAMADNMNLSSRPVDLIVQSHLGAKGLPTLLAATGKRLAYEGASFTMGPMTAGTPSEKSEDTLFRTELTQEYNRDIEHLIMSRSGETDVEKVRHDLTRGEGMSSMQALAYGTEGLIDGILIAGDRVITREHLDAYLEKNELTGQAKEDFLREYNNTRKLTSTTLKKASPESITDPKLQQKRGGRYQHFLERIARNATIKGAYGMLEKNVKERQAVAAKVKDAEIKTPPSPLMNNTHFTFMMGGKMTQSATLAPVSKVSKDNRGGHIQIINPKMQDTQNVLFDDVVFFNDGFNDEVAEQVNDGLNMLDEKKNRTPDSSNIKMVVNSPGGSVWAAQNIRTNIKLMDNDVDVIVQGMAASAGAWILSSATGNRFATPMSRIMIHQAGTAIPNQANDLYLDRAMSLKQSTNDYIGVVSRATGRPFSAVEKDFNRDMWMNPLEALFYGNKGMIDAVLVGPNEVLTREDVHAYLTDTLGSEEAADKYVKNRIKSLRSTKSINELTQPDENDPFDHPLRTIEAIKANGTQALGEAKVFPRGKERSLSASASRQQNAIDYAIVADPNVK